MFGNLFSGFIKTFKLFFRKIVQIFSQ